MLIILQNIHDYIKRKSEFSFLITYSFILILSEIFIYFSVQSAHNILSRNNTQNFCSIRVSFWHNPTREIISRLYIDQRPSEKSQQLFIHSGQLHQYTIIVRSCDLRYDRGRVYATHLHNAHKSPAHSTSPRAGGGDDIFFYFTHIAHL